MKKIDQLLKKTQYSIKLRKEREYFYIHQQRYRFILRKILSLGLPPNAKILDTGCFPPHIFHALENLGFEVWGIASEHEPVKIKKAVSVNIETDKIPLRESYFDLILLSEVIEHLVVSPKIYFPKLKKLLKGNGVILITTPNAAHLKNRIKLLLGRSTSFGIDQLYETGWGDGSIYYRHNREFAGSELKQIVKDQKLKIKDHGYFSAYTPFRKNLSRGRIDVAVRLAGFLITIIYPGLKDSQYILVAK